MTTMAIQQQSDLLFGYDNAFKTRTISDQNHNAIIDGYAIQYGLTQTTTTPKYYKKICAIYNNNCVSKEYTFLTKESSVGNCKSKF